MIVLYANSDPSKRSMRRTALNVSPSVKTVDAGSTVSLDDPGQSGWRNPGFGTGFPPYNYRYMTFFLDP